MNKVIDASKIFAAKRFCDARENRDNKPEFDVCKKMLQGFNQAKRVADRYMKTPPEAA